MHDRTTDNSFFEILNTPIHETIASRILAYLISADIKFLESFLELLMQSPLYTLDEAECRFERESNEQVKARIKDLLTSIQKQSPSGPVPSLFKPQGHLCVDCENMLYEAGKGRGRADIWIGSNIPNPDGKKLRMIIENKIDASFQGKQLRKYYRYLTSEKDGRENAGLVLLCPKSYWSKNSNTTIISASKKLSYKAIENQRIEDEKPSTSFILLTYEDVLKWINDGGCDEKILSVDSRNKFIVVKKESAYFLNKK